MSPHHVIAAISKKNTLRMYLSTCEGKPSTRVDEWHVSESRCNVYLCWQRISDLMPANKPLHNSSSTCQPRLSPTPSSSNKTQDAPGDSNLQSQIHPEPRSPSIRVFAESWIKIRILLTPSRTSARNWFALFVVYSISLSIIKMTSSIFIPSIHFPAVF